MFNFGEMILAGAVARQRSEANRLSDELDYANRQIGLANRTIRTQRKEIEDLRAHNAKLQAVIDADTKAMATFAEKIGGLAKAPGQIPPSPPPLKAQEKPAAAPVVKSAQEPDLETMMFYVRQGREQQRQKSLVGKVSRAFGFGRKTR